MCQMSHGFSGSDVSPSWSKDVKNPWISGEDVPRLEAVRPAHRQQPGLRDGRGPDSPLGRPKRRPRPCRLAMGSMGPAIVDLVTV